MRRRALQSQPEQAEAPRQVLSAIVRHSIDETRPIRLNPHLSALINQEGIITFGWSAPDALNLELPESFFDELPRLRAGETTLAELKQSELWSPKVDRALQQLWHAKHLRYSSDWHDTSGSERYSRQLGWLSMNQEVRGREPDVIAKLKRESVAILGVGGLGTHVAWNLAASGVGNLHLVDGDTIELSNLNRQLFYTPADVGLRKVDVVAERLLQFNPDLVIRKTHKYLNGVDDILEVIRGSSMVVRAIDSPNESPVWVNEACVREGIPYMAGGFLPQGALVGPMVIPGETACLLCNQQTVHQRADRGSGGTLAPFVTATAGLFVAEIITYLAKLGPVRTAGRALAIHAPELGFGFVDISRNEQCAVCGQGSVRRESA